MSEYINCFARQLSIFDECEKKFNVKVEIPLSLEQNALNLNNYELSEEELIKKYSYLVKSVLKSLNLTSRIDYENYYDVGLIGLYSGLKSSTNDFNISYLFKFIKNAIIDEIRKSQNNFNEITFSSLLDNQSLDDDIDDIEVKSSYDLEYEVELKEKKSIILNYLNNPCYFNQQHKEIFINFYGLKGIFLSKEELSNYYNLSVTTINTILIRTFNRLRSLCEEKND